MTAAEHAERFAQALRSTGYAVTVHADDDGPRVVAHRPDAAPPVGWEAVCTRCGETFNPDDEHDTIHVWNTERDAECGGQGRITGSWR